MKTTEMISNSKIKKVETEAKKFFKNLKGCHGWDHVERVTASCEHIGSIEKADLKVLRLAALLHDVGRDEEFRTNGKVCHAERGAFIAKKILNDQGMEKEVVDRVIHCIVAHRFRGKEKPDSKEARILSDADNLDAMGAIGVARYLYFACAIGARIHNSKGVNLLEIREYTEEDTAYREYLFKHKELPKRMFTKEGKKLAKERLVFMKKYFDRLNQEVEGII